jgi:hypothetical protein
MFVTSRLRRLALNLEGNLGHDRPICRNVPPHDPGKAEKKRCLAEVLQECSLSAEVVMSRA